MSIDAVKNLGHYFSQWRARAGLSLRDLSVMCGVDHATISGLEKGRIKPPKNAVNKIADALNLSVEERANLDRWADQIGNVQRIEAKTTGIQAQFTLRALAIFSSVDVSDIARVWIQGPEDNALDAFVCLKSGKVIGVKLGGATDVWIGEESSEGHLPTLAQSTRRIVRVTEP